MKKAKAVLVGGVVLLTLAWVFGCSLLPREEVGAPAANGWYIRLQIWVPASAKGITVSELDVTGLNIQVRDPAGEPLESIAWAPGDDSTYLVQAKQLGRHQIVVTHLGERDGEPVQAIEETYFEIRAMKITVIDIVPGGIGLIWIEGEEPAPSINLTGYWDVFLTVDDLPEMGPDVFYILQDGSALDCSVGLSGAIEGPNVSLEAWFGPSSKAVLIGTVSGEQITGSFTGLPFGSGNGTFRLVRSTMVFGRLDLDGTCQGVPISLHTYQAVGSLDASGEPDGGPDTRFNLHFNDNVLRVWLFCGFPGPTPPSGPYDWHIGFTWQPDAEPQLDDGDAEAGTMTITRFDEAGISGEFSASFPGGDIVTGSFDVSFNEFGLE